MLGKILITGAFSTGKTTLVNHVASACRAQGIPIRVVADTARASPLPLNRQQTLFTSLWLFGSQVAAESLAASEAPCRAVLCDRGIPDIVSHTPLIHWYGEGEGNPLALVTMARAWARTYDRVLWARPDPAWDIAPDGVRVVDRSYQNELDSVMPKVFDFLGLTAEELPQDPAERLTVTMGLLRSMS